ncbi:putative transmembranal protein [Bdellovibrio phage MAC3UK]|nr:putative transmembranal protein [Bdellovibrio phage MAC3UK]
MVKMQKNTKLPRLAQSKFALLLILLTGIISCAGVPKFPKDIHVWETANAQGQWFCGEYEPTTSNITRAKDIKFKPVKDHDLSKCVGVFGFKDKDFPAVLDWMDRVQTYYEDRLKRCEAKK